MCQGKHLQKEKQVLAVQSGLGVVASSGGRCRGREEQECLVLGSVEGQGQGAGTGERVVLSDTG